MNNHISLKDNPTLLRYAGGKTRAVKMLMNHIPRERCDIVSPFFGGGAFEIYLLNKGHRVFGADIFYQLVCFWQSAIHKNKLLHHKIYDYIGITAEQFYSLQKSILLMTDEVDIGAAFFVLNRCSFSGTGLSGGISPSVPRFTLSSIDKVLNFLPEKLSVECQSFDAFLKKHDGFVYADPPYAIKNDSLYGVKGSTHKQFNHELLAKLLLGRDEFLLSYNDCELVRDLYSGCEFHVAEWAYGMNKTKKSNEVIIKRVKK